MRDVLVGVGDVAGVDADFGVDLNADADGGVVVGAGYDADSDSDADAVFVGKLVPSGNLRKLRVACVEQRCSDYYSGL